MSDSVYGGLAGVAAPDGVASNAPRRCVLPRRPGLQLRFLLWVLVSATLFALAAGTLAYQLGMQRATQSAEQAASDLQTAIEKTAAIAAYARDPLLMREVVDGAARNELVSSAEIDDAQGRPLVRSGRDANNAASATHAPSVQRVLRSPFDAQESVGVLRIALDGARVQATARREASTLALLMVAQIALIAAVIYLAGARLVSQPIVRLARELAAMPPGTEQRLAMPAGHDHDELGALVGSANALLQANAQTLQRERALRREVEAMEAQYRQIFDSTSAGIFVLDREGRLINGNPTVLRVVGGEITDMRQLRGQDFLGRVFANPDRVRTMIAAAAARGETMSADLELRAADGVTRWVHCLVSVQDAHAAALGDSGGGIVEGVMYDITERKRVERDVRRRAEHDALTGALNRAAIEEIVDRFIEQAGGDDAMTLMYIDLDGFKQINDTQGHKAGDQVLQQVTQRLEASLRRSSDRVGRIGGDEFVIVLQHRGPDDGAAGQIAAGSLERLREPIELEGGVRVQLGASIGLATYPRHGRSRRELMHMADEAMYAVKRHGKNSFASALRSAG
jgi:diguanylate cyclase (GGDEF)-like protein/PAS domain S-box-containing protein